MKAMLLAAGRGARMQPLTDYLPKPLVPVAGKPLISHQLIALAAAGFREIIINVSYRSEQIQAHLGDGANYGVKIYYSVEPSALETGGGIYQALPLLGPEAFLVMSGDIWTDYPFTHLRHYSEKFFSSLAHLVLVDNPEFHPRGDFGLDQDGLLSYAAHPTLTFANIGIYQPALFTNCQPGKFPLIDVLRPAIQAKKISGEYFRGHWNNVGTMEQLQTLNQQFSEQDSYVK